MSDWEPLAMVGQSLTTKEHWTLGRACTWPTLGLPVTVADFLGVAQHLPFVSDMSGMTFWV
jgi:hypothetical protein